MENKAKDQDHKYQLTSLILQAIRLVVDPLNYFQDR